MKKPPPRKKRSYLPTFEQLEDRTVPTSVQFHASAFNVNENGTAANVTVDLDAASAQTVTVDYATSDGTAAAGSDYTGTSGTLSFSPGEMSKTFTVAITNDSTDENDETINLTLTNPSNAVVGLFSGPRSPGTLADDGSIGTANWWNPGNAGASDNSYAVTYLDYGSYTISHYLKATNFGFAIPSEATITGIIASVEAHTDSNIAYDTTVKLVKGGSITGNNKAANTTIGTADAYRSYGSTTDLWGTTLTPADVNAANFGFAVSYDPPMKDSVYVDHMRVTVYYTGTSSGTLTIQDNDDPPTVQFSSPTYSVGEAGGSKTVTVNLSAASGKTVTVAYASSNGTATAGSDYTATSGTLTFNPGDTSKTFAVPITNDSADENDETINLSLSNPSNALFVSSSSGPNSPSTLAEDSGIGTGSWYDTSNAGASDNSFAQGYAPLNGSTYYLKATNFGFAIPSGATITGIVAAVEAQTDNHMATDATIKLVKAGSVTGDNKGTNTVLPQTDAYRSYGSSTDLWGTSLTPSDVNAANFGFVASYGALNDGVNNSGVPYVDHMRVTVYYAAASSFSATLTILDDDTPPSISNQSFSVYENSANSTVVGTVSASDVDPGQSLTYAITAGNTGGAFQINSGTGQINVANSAALDFETTPSFALTVQVTDNGTPVLSNSATATINVTNVNEAPQGSDNACTLSEDSNYTFSAADFGFSDPNDSAGNNFLAVKVVTVPGSGTLKNDGVPVSAGDFVTVTSITAGKLVFTPAANANGSGYANFTFKVQDDGGTSNGGVDLDAMTRTMTINVAVVNDAPSFTKGSNQTVNEDAGAQTVTGWATDISAGPSDESGQTLTFQVVGIDNPSLFASRPSVDAATGNLTYTPAANANGTATIQLRLHDDGGTDYGGVNTSDTQTFTIQVNAVNDAPVIMVPQSQIAVQSNALLFSASTGNSILIDDVDAGTGNLTVTLSVDHGTLDATQSGSVTVTGQNTDSLELAGNLTDLIATLDTLSYTPDTYSGLVTLTIHADDQGNTGSGGALTADDSVDIQVVDNYLAGRVWLDIDQDGTQGSDEPGLPDVSIGLYDTSDVLQSTTTTDDSGFYAFSNILNGDYYLEFAPPSGFTFSPQDVGSDLLDSDADRGGQTAGFTLATGTNLVLDAGVYGTGTISGRAWEDSNADGIQDTGESGLSGVTVKLYKADATLVTSTSTASDGSYSFSSVDSGYYYVEFIKPSGDAFSPPYQGTDATLDSDANVVGQTASIFLTNGAIANVDAGLYSASGSVNGTIWEDANYDGIHDPTEAGLAGVTVELYNGGVLADSTTTDASGAYGFSSVGWGTYTIQVSPLSDDYDYSEKGQGSNASLDSDVNGIGESDSFMLNSGGTTSITVDAGQYNMNPPIGTIGGWVWLDANNNDVQDTGESGAVGVMVDLYRSDNTYLDSAKTDSAGAYSFAVLGGDYYLKVNAPAYYGFALQAQGSDATLDSDVDSTGQSGTLTLDPSNPPANNLDVDAGLQIASSTPVGADDVYLIDEYGHIGVSATDGVLVNDFDASNPDLFASLVTSMPAGEGTLTFYSDGSFSFTAGAGFNNMTSFQYLPELPGIPGTGPRIVNLYGSLVAFQNSLALRSVSYLTSHPLILRDGRLATFGNPYEFPQWRDVNGNGLATDPGDNQYPTSYTRNTPLRVNASFAVDPAQTALWRGRVRVRADGPGNLDLGYARPVFATLTGNSLIITREQFDNPLPNQVQYYESFNLTWQLSPDNGRSWITPAVANTSHNELYVTWNDPSAGLRFYQTLPYLGSSLAAGQTTKENVITKIFDGFRDTMMTNYGGSTLHYYASWNASTFSETTSTLLRFRDGDCVAWASFFIDVLRAQGITANRYVARSLYGAQLGNQFVLEQFMVKEWTFGAANLPARFRRRGLPTNNNTGIGQVTYTHYVLANAGDTTAGANQWAASKAAGSFLFGAEPVIQDQPGIWGQCTTNPPSIFSNHCMVTVGNSGPIYDPSYGETYTSLANFKAKAIAGFMLEAKFNEMDNNFDFNMDGIIQNVDVRVFLVRGPAGRGIFGPPWPP